MNHSGFKSTTDYKNKKILITNSTTAVTIKYVEPVLKKRERTIGSSNTRVSIKENPKYPIHKRRLQYNISNQFTKTRTIRVQTQRFQSNGAILEQESPNTQFNNRGTMEYIAPIYENANNPSSKARVPIKGNNSKPYLGGESILQPIKMPGKP